MAEQPSDGQAPGLLAKLLAGERRPSEIVAEVDEGKPVRFLTQLQFELLTAAQREVGIGLVAAERKQQQPNECEAAAPPHNDNDNQVTWLHDAGSEPPPEFYRDKWLTGTQTEIGFAIRHTKLKAVKDRALRNYLKNAASGQVPRLWCRNTLTSAIDAFFRDPKSLHEAEARLLDYRKR